MKDVSTMDGKQHQAPALFVPESGTATKTMQEVFEEMQAAGKPVPAGWMQQKSKPQTEPRQPSTEAQEPQ